MKEIYDWVPWFKELSGMIADNGEAFLVERAKQVLWKEGGGNPAVLLPGDENINPFSFIYAVASLAPNAHNRIRVFPSVTDVFGLTTSLPLDRDEAFIFPTPSQRFKLFQNTGERNPPVLWSLFRAGVHGTGEVLPEEFNAALDLTNVGIKSLTHVLFLANADQFLPHDTMQGLAVANLPKSGATDWASYMDGLQSTVAAFPDCMPYEINLFGYEVGKKTDPLKVNSHRCYQISTRVYGGDEDWWDDFESNNCAYTGGPGSGLSWEDELPETGGSRYPLQEPAPGNVLLVRSANRGHGIAVVYRNDYSQTLSGDAKLHVLWVSKKKTDLDWGPHTRGFGHADGELGKAFREAYPETLAVLDRLSPPPTKQSTGNGHPPVGPTSPTTTRAHALNTILYGPPGTGKTYATTQLCVEICDGKVPEDVEALRARYGELMDDGRIDFVTFHQSYGYEEFVEGLRPETASETGTGFHLEVVPGVLKRIAEQARKVPEMGRRLIFKMSLGDPKCWGGSQEKAGIFAECIKTGCVLLEYGGDIDWSDDHYDDWKEIRETWRMQKNRDATSYNTDIQAMWRFRTEMRPGDIVVVSDGFRHFRAVGEITGGYEFRRRDDGFHHRRNVTWHWHVHDREGDPVSVFKNGALAWRPAVLMTPANPAGLVPYFKGVGEIAGARPHVLVIDEINRANISKVMGELITLLEEDKREGAENEVAATLPYSGDRFTLSGNLYILGTMNTADRSIALIDTALRRRFQFEEMSPNPMLLEDAKKRSDIDLPRVLQTMNERLEYLVDRDHLIGHAWFMAAESREDVDDIMRHRIIPLIAEYFYDDWSKVRAVLGGGDHFVKGVKLKRPPELNDGPGDDRYRWTVQGSFPEDAYVRLVDPASREEPTG